MFVVLLRIEFELLGKQDSSRLPFGFVEKFAFAADRRKLLNVRASDEKKEEKDGEKPAMDANKSDLVQGSEEHAYYSMLQVENEIEQCYKKLNMNNTTKNKNNNDNNNSNDDILSTLKQLKKEFLTWIVKVETKDRYTAYNPYPLLSGRVKRLVSRYWIRELPNLNNMDRKKAIKVIKDTCNPYYGHFRQGSYDPSHIRRIRMQRQKNGDTKEENGPKYDVRLRLAELQGKCLAQMKSDYKKMLDIRENYHNRSISSQFSEQSLTWILNRVGKDMFENFNSDRLTNMFNSFPNLRLVSDNENKILVKAVSKQIERSFLAESELQKYEHPTKFGDSEIHNKLTIDEMNELGGIHNDLWKSNKFLDLYVKKMMPSTMLKYEDESWNVVPKKMRLEFLLKLYQWVIECINNDEKLNDPKHNTIKGYFIWKYMCFIWKNYVCNSNKCCSLF